MNLFIRNVDEKLVAKIEKLAKENHRKRSQQIVLMLEEAIE
jgi:hypothetical protein